MASFASSSAGEVPRGEAASSDLASHLQATLGSSYTIERELGGAGMSRVFLATETALHRQVVIKVLPAELAEGLSADRFAREIRVAARLQHPNIVPLLNAGSSAGLPWFTMPFVRGDSLRARMDGEPLDLRAALRVLTDLARALAYAHGAGILHRDIKPENVLLSEGVAVVTDFGIAKAVHDAQASAGNTTLTRSGTTLGTPAYMAPEQVAGDPAVDHRADLYALGVVAYELLAGVHPFADAQTPQQLLVAHLVRAPSPLAERAPRVPGGVAEAVMQCLEKDPAARPGSAAALLAILEAATDRAPETPTPVPAHATSSTAGDGIPSFRGRPAIAVLPFENRSSDPDQEYFADGITEDLITRLSAWRSYPVIARHASFAHRGSALDMRRLGETLGARYIVQGSVRKAGTRVRIVAHLVDAANSQEVWAQTFDRDLTDIFAVQDEISQAIAAPLVGDIQRAELHRAARRAPESLDAWELYHRATSAMSTFTAESMAQARSLLERAVAADPQFAPAWSALAEVGIYDVMGGWRTDPDRVVEQAVLHARRGVELEPNDGEAHNSLSFALMMAKDSFGAMEASRRALELNPSLPRALTLYAYHRQIAGFPPEESIALVQRAVRLSPHDPYEWLYYDVLAGTFFNAGRFSEGLEAGQKLITISPHYYWGYLWSAMNAVGLGRGDEARAFVAEGRRVQPDLSFELAQACLGTMAPDVERRFLGALRVAGLE